MLPSPLSASRVRDAGLPGSPTLLSPISRSRVGSARLRSPKRSMLGSVGAQSTSMLLEMDAPSPQGLHSLTRRANEKLQRVLHNVNSSRSATPGSPNQHDFASSMPEKAFTDLAQQLETQLHLYKTEHNESFRDLSRSAPVAASTPQAKTPTTFGSTVPSTSATPAGAAGGLAGPSVLVDTSITGLTSVRGSRSGVLQGLGESRVLSPHKQHSPNSLVSRVHARIEAARTTFHPTHSPIARSKSAGRRRIAPQEDFVTPHEVVDIIEQKRERRLSRQSSAKQKRQLIWTEKKQAAIAASVEAKHEQMRIAREHLMRQQKWSAVYCLAVSFVTMRVKYRAKQIELANAPAVVAPVVSETAAVPKQRLSIAAVVIAKMQALKLRKNFEVIRKAMREYIIRNRMFQKTNAANVVLSFLIQAKRVRRPFQMLLHTYHLIVKAQRIWRRRRMQLLAQFSLLCQQWDVVETKYLLESPFHGFRDPSSKAPDFFSFDEDALVSGEAPQALYGRRIPKHIRNKILLENMLSRRRAWYRTYHDLASGGHVKPSTHFATLLPRPVMRNLIENTVERINSGAKL